MDNNNNTISPLSPLPQQQEDEELRHKLRCLGDKLIENQETIKKLCSDYMAKRKSIEDSLSGQKLKVAKRELQVMHLSKKQSLSDACDKLLCEHHGLWQQLPLPSYLYSVETAPSEEDDKKVDIVCEYATFTSEAEAQALCDSMNTCKYQKLVVSEVPYSSHEHSDTLIDLPVRYSELAFKPSHTS